MKLALNLLALLLLTACSSGPVDIDYGSDECHYCKMFIVDNQHAAEVVTSKGKAFKFDAIECLIPHLEQNSNIDFRHILVNDYNQPGSLVPAETCTYIISKSIPSPMGAYLSAVQSRDAAEQLQTLKGGDLYTWSEINDHLSRKQSHGTE
jgi:copper chaperone NosL